MVDKVQLKAELDADPLVRGYAGMSDQEAADSINAVDRPGAADPEAVQRTVLLERHRSNNGGDTAATNIYGRLKVMSEATVGVDVFGQSNQGGDELSVAEDVHSACTFLRMIAGDLIPLEMQGSAIAPVLNDLVRAEVMGAGDRAALKALSDNKQSRGQEIGVGNVIAGDVLAARNLP